uniref:Uncharacterized protein n=1 Tax=Siphoviridae sp. ctxMM9 TaxID=2827973 RepID=A0A8S5T7U7_9CAUD|nr:MAG TPA: hypothetical protein [Siphoviridae sp. ctxMM9]
MDSSRSFCLFSPCFIFFNSATNLSIVEVNSV